MIFMFSNMLHRLPLPVA